MRLLKVLALLLTTNALAVNSSLQSSEAKLFPFADAPRNYVRNSGIEKNAANITDASLIAGRSTSLVLEGVASLEINAGSSTQKVVFISDPFQTGLHNQVCEANFIYYGDASLYKAYVQINSVTVSSEITLTNSGTSSQPVSISFPCGTDGSNGANLNIEATGDGAQFSVDSVYVGKALNIGSAAQAEVVAQMSRVTQQTISTTAVTAINFDSNVVLKGSLSTGVYTVPTSGIYKIDSWVRVSGVGSGAFEFTTQRNSASIGGCVANPDLSTETNKSNTCAASFNAGDTIRIVLSTTVDNSYAVEQAAANITRFPTTSEQVFRVGAPGLDWTAFTPTGSWTSGLAYAGQYKCDGGMLSVQYYLSITNGILPTSTLLRLNLPAGFTIDTTKLASGTNVDTSIPGGIVSWLDSGTSSGPGARVDYHTTTSVTPTYAVSQAATSATTAGGFQHNIPFTWANGDRISVSFTVPVTASSPCPRAPMPLLAASVSYGTTVRAEGLAGSTTVDYGTYTPTLTNGTNVASSTAKPCVWERIGSVVDVSCHVTVACTAAALANTVIDFSLPVASNIASTDDLSGNWTGGIALSASETGRILGNAANDRAGGEFKCVTTGSHDRTLNFKYVVK